MIFMRQIEYNTRSIAEHYSLVLLFAMFPAEYRVKLYLAIFFRSHLLHFFDYFHRRALATSTLSYTLNNENSFFSIPGIPKVHMSFKQLINLLKRLALRLNKHPPDDGYDDNIPASIQGIVLPANISERNRQRVSHEYGEAITDTLGDRNAFRALCKLEDFRGVGVVEEHPGA